MAKSTRILVSGSSIADSPHEIAAAIAQKVRNVRTTKGWTLRELEVRSGVSKALLSRIERAEGNPSLETLWRIVGALDVSFSELIQKDDPEPRLIRADEGRQWSTEDGTMEVRLVFSPSITPKFEVYELSMPAGVRSEWHSHGFGVHEHVLVSEGELLLSVGDKEYRLSPGDFLAFPADRDHVYHSLDTPIRAVCIMRYAH